jgi:hypothetical protein
MRGARHRHLSAVPLANQLGQRLDVEKHLENSHFHRSVPSVVPLSRLWGGVNKEVRHQDSGVRKPLPSDF